MSARTLCTRCPWWVDVSHLEPDQVNRLWDAHQAKHGVHRGFCINNCGKEVGEAVPFCSAECRVAYRAAGYHPAPIRLAKERTLASRARARAVVAVGDRYGAERDRQQRKWGGLTMGYGCQRDFHLNDFHLLNAERCRKDFAPEHGLMALVVCVQEEVGELAASVLGVTGEKKRKAHLTKADCLDAVADAMTYLSLVATKLGCDDLESLLGRTFNMVSDRAGSSIKIGYDSGAHPLTDEHKASCPVCQ